jgi:aspartyl-tRNA(Asn)/glutamyl-tRNA(Gln) amidotransferase subunit A
MSYASSLDTVGLFTNTVEDIAYILPHISGPSSKDMTTMKEPFPSFEVFQKKREIFSLKNKNIGYITECMENPALDPEIQESLFSFYKKLEKEGANIVPVSFPEISYANPAYFVLAKSEGSSNYARYDGVRYGHHSKKAQNQEEGFSLSRAEGFGDEVRRCIMLGTYMLSSGEYDKYFKKAAQVRALISKRFQVLFSSCDILLSPVSPFFPFKIGEKIDDPVALYASDQFTTPASLAGIPALSLPISMKKGFPVSLQIMAPFGEDMRTLLYGDRFSHRIIM